MRTLYSFLFSLCFAFLFALIMKPNIGHAEVSGSVLDGLIAQQNINQTEKPQYSSLGGANETVDPNSGKLTWTQNQIHLPGRDGLDLDIGVLYDSNYSFSYMRSSTSSKQVKKYNYYISRYDLGVGFSFTFPSIQLADGGYKYYHHGDGQIYRFDTSATSEPDKTTHLIGYQGKDMKLMTDSSTTGLYNNGQERSKYYLEYANKKREYFAQDGRLLGIVDRFGNEIKFQHIDRLMYDGKTYKVISSITDTLNRTVTFTYESNISSGNDESIYVTVKDANNVQTNSVTYLKYAQDLLFNSTPDGYVPNLWEIDNEDDYIYFGYDVQTGRFIFTSKSFTNSGYNSYNLLTDVYYRNASTHTTYDKVTRNLGSGGVCEDFRVTSSYDDKSGGTSPAGGYSHINYTYKGDYTGYPAYTNPAALPTTYYYSSTSTVQSSTPTFGLENTTNFDGKGKHVSTVTLASNGEKKVVNNLLFDSILKSKPTKTQIMESDGSSTNVLYVGREYADWGGVLSETQPLTDTQFNNASTKAKYTTTYTYDTNFYFPLSKSWYKDIESTTPIIESYQYYPSGRLKSTTDAVGTVVNYCYESTDGLTSTCTNPSATLNGKVGKIKATKLLGGGQVATTETIYKADTQFAYPGEIITYFTTLNDSNQNVSQTTKKSYTYYGTGLIQTETDGAGRTTRYEYDALRRLTKIQYPKFINLANTQYDSYDQYQYDYVYTPSTADSETRNIYSLRVTSSRTYVTTSGSTQISKQVSYYDGLGLLRYDQLIGGGQTQTTQYHWDDLKRAVYMIDPMGYTTTVSYDEWGNQKESIDSDNNLYVTETNLLARESTTYFVAASNVATYRTNPYLAANKSSVLKKSYDQWGRLLSNTAYKTWPSTSQPVTETYSYDLTGNVVTQTDPKGNVNDEGVTSKFSYDAKNRLTSIKDALGQITKYEYNANDQIVRTTIQNGNSGTQQVISTKTYNEVGLITSKTDPNNQKESYSIFNNVGLLEKTTDRNGTIYRYQYDERNLPKIQTVTGMVGGVTQKLQTETTIGYNGILNDKIQTLQSNVTGTLVDSGILTTGIDSLKRTTSKQIQESGFTSYLGLAYDLNNRITQISSGTNSASTFNVLYKYAKKNLEKVQVDGQSTVNNLDSTNVKYTYYPNGQLQSITYPPLPNGKLLTINYTYDALNRVSTVQNKNGVDVLSSFTYGYDNNGNITSIIEVRGQFTTTSNYTYDKLNRLTGTSRNGGATVSYTYDLKGNRQAVTNNAFALTPETTRYDYDLLNKLKSITKGAAVTSFEYAPDNLRYKKTSGSTVSQYRYNQNGEVIAEVNGSNQTTANYVRGDRLLVKKDVATSKNYYYLYNGHGDVVQMVDASTGNVVNSYSYDEWGNILQQTEDPSASNIFKYAGEVYDNETGLYYLRARYYDPSVGRFINEDTYEGQVNNPLSLNLYTYVQNNPLIYTDPSGMCGVKSWGDAGDCFVKAGKAVKKAAVATYNFLIGDDLNTLFDPNSSQQEKDMAAKMLALNFIPGEGQVAKIGLKAAEKQALKIAEEQLAKQILKESDQFINIYRAVGAEEFYQIMKSGSFMVSPMGFDGKQFGLNFDDTLKFAEKYKDIAAIVEVKVSKTELDRLADYTHVDPFIFKNGTLTIHLENLDDFNKIIQAISHKY
ncbi:RHS repeat domain-containing protein [Cohnella sp. AR92]|uniref:RHS repeat domain-containing protein n=1 Tax=Cohnella sp. AR92 TaxID=648716 RepID=UPI000F8CAC23|nr:RHS repeat domain-containing protein [Cohnella sp. AR92]RUS43551.1 RHS repeat protein [Cohnella sp. AR92]